MDKIDSFETDHIAEAVILWTGWKQQAFPRRNDSQLVTRFGPNLASKLLIAIKSLEDDFYSSDARFTATDLAEMETMSTEHFRRKHPQLPDEIAKAFAWCYTFDFK
jgi:hypothetical protein